MLNSIITHEEQHLSACLAVHSNANNDVVGLSESVLKKVKRSQDRYMAIDLDKICITSNKTLRDAVERMNVNLKGIVLVTDSQRRLIGSLVDGDIRRAVLSGKNLDTLVGEVLLSKAVASIGNYSGPIWAPIGTGDKILLQMMDGYSVQQIPLLDSESRVVDLVSIEDILDQPIVSYDAGEIVNLCVSPRETMHYAMEQININQQGIALVVNDQQKLIGAINDGDVRRFLMGGGELEMPISEYLQIRMGNSPGVPPVIAVPDDADQKMLMGIMEKHTIKQVPMTDDQGRLVGLVTLKDLLQKLTLPICAVVMAGGFGTRLRPLTNNIPKPMLPIDGKRPLLEVIISQLRDSGIRRMNVTTHYMPEVIMDHFGDGKEFGVDINYVYEDKPLGTAGALGLMKRPEEPIFVINGDILTKVGIQSMYKYHKKHEADLTVAVRQHQIQVPYGVIQTDGPAVVELEEKPCLSHLINAGIYLLDPSVHSYIPAGERFDMTDLIELLISKGKKVVCFPIYEYWLDIGQHGDYEKAQHDFVKEQW